MSTNIKLKQLYGHFMSSKESQWVMVWDNAKDLFEFITKHDIKKVLDLGTGIGVSASVVALALQEKGITDYKIDTIEQYPKCVTLANDLIPDELKKNMSIIQSDVVVWNSEKMPHLPLSTYRELPEEQYDLIINDGPAPFIENEHYVDLPNGTIHKMLLEGKIKDGAFIIYDGRIQSLGLLERYFSGNFALVHVPQQGSDFAVLEKKGGEVKYFDEKLEAMKTRTTYFKDVEEKKNEKDSLPLH